MLSQRLKMLREERGLLQSDIAKLLNITSSAYGYYEQGKREPKPDALLLLANLYEVSTDYLLGKTNNRNAASKLESQFDSMTYENKLRYWINKTGLSYAEVAEKLEIPEKQFMSYLNNEKDIPCKLLIALSEICDVSTDCLLGITNKSRNRDFDKILPFHYKYDISERIKKLCQKHNIDINSSYLENLLSLSNTEVFYLIEYGFVPHIDTITKLAKDFNVSIDYLLCQIDEEEEKVLKSFHLLNADNKDIIIGEIKKCLKEQRYEDSVAADRVAEDPGIYNPTTKQGKLYPSNGTEG